MASPRRPREPDWIAIRDGYAAGRTAANLAVAHGVPIDTIKKRASAGEWGKLRHAVCAQVALDLPSAIASAVVDEAAHATAQHLSVLGLGLAKAEALLADIANPIQFSAWASGVKALVQTQRLALGIAPPAPQSSSDGRGGINGSNQSRPDFTTVDPAEAARRVREALRDG